MRWIQSSIAVGLAMLGGCAAPEPTLQSLKVDLALIGTVALVGEFDVFHGDVAEVWKIHSMTVEAGTGRFEFVTSGSNCSIGPQADQNYLVIVNRLRMETISGSRKLYEASACIPLDSVMAANIRQYSPRRARH